MTRRAGVPIGRGLLGCVFLTMVCGARGGGPGTAPTSAPATIPPGATATGPTTQKTSAGFILSRQTTFVLGPVRADGTIDYLAALDAHFSRGVTAENNAATPLLKAVGPGILSVNARAGVYKRLSLQPLPAEGGYFVPLDAYVAAHAPPQTQPGGPPGPSAEERKALEAEVAKAIEQGKPITSELLAKIQGLGPAEPTAADLAGKDRERAMRKTWTGKDYPLLAEWLKANEKPLAMIAEATKRPRYYMPLVSTSDPPLMLDALLPTLGVYREAARALAARAMLRCGSGDFRGAREDLLAVHRLARLIAQGPTLIDRLVGIAIESLGTSSEGALAAGGYLSAEQAKALLADLEVMPEIPNLVEVFDFSERFFMLDAVMVCQREGFARAVAAMPAGEGQAPPPSLAAWAAAGMVDWNEVLRRANAWYDRYADAAGRPTVRQRLSAAQKVAEDLRQFSVQVSRRTEPRALAWRLTKGVVLSKERTDVAGDMLLSLLLPSLGRASQIRDEAVMRLELTKVALALAAYKGQKGAYPEKLADLSPGYLKAVPQDAFTEAPLRYQRTPRGYVLYSLGANAADDGGKDRTAGADDLVIRAE